MKYNNYVYLYCDRPTFTYDISFDIHFIKRCCIIYSYIKLRRKLEIVQITMSLNFQNQPLSKYISPD